MGTEYHLKCTKCNKNVFAIAAQAWGWWMPDTRTLEGEHVDTNGKALLNFIREHIYDCNGNLRLIYSDDFLEPPPEFSGLTYYELIEELKNKDEEIRRLSSLKTPKPPEKIFIIRPPEVAQKMLAAQGAPAPSNGAEDAEGPS